MKLQKIVNHLQELHPKEIDLSLDRIKNLCKNLGNPQDNLKTISIVGTNGKYSTIRALFAILKEANFNCNIYTSPHIVRINERFIFNNHELNDEDLSKLLEDVAEANNNDPITFFEILTAAYFYQAAKTPENINLIEAGLFHRFDATNILKKNLASVVTSIGLDHLDWLPKNEKNIEKIIFEKTSTLLNSNIIVSKQSSDYIKNEIKKSLSRNNSKKYFFGDDYNYLFNENGFVYYEDKQGGIKLPQPNIKGQFQLDNISNAIATLRSIEELNVNENHIKNGITKIKSIARLQEINSGKLKELVRDNTLLVDGSHNPLGAKVLNEYLNSLDCNKHIILGMMANKNHKEYMSYFKNISTLTTIDIPNQPNSINGKELKNKLNSFKNVQYKESISEAIKSIPVKKNDIILITGSLYLAGEVLNLN